MTKNEFNAFQRLLADLSKLESRARKKAEGEREILQSKYIMLKGIECYNRDDILSIYGCGDCTEKQCDDALERLAKKQQVDVNEKTLHEYYVDLVQKISCNLAEEIKDAKKNGKVAE